MDVRTHYASAVALLLICVCSLSQTQAQDTDALPPNVLFVAIDDLRTELGCYGLPHVQSPQLDRLATESVLFTGHYVQAPTCGASRYALLTGQSPARSGAHGNQSLYQGRTRLSQKELDAPQTFPERFSSPRLSHGLYRQDFAHARWSRVCLRWQRRRPT